MTGKAFMAFAARLQQGHQIAINPSFLCHATSLLLASSSMVIEPAFHLLLED